MDSNHDLNEDILETIDLYSRTVAKVAYTYVQNIADAEDIAQDVFLELLNRKIPFNDQDHTKAWLIRVTINKCKNLLKSGWHKNTSPITDDIPYTDEQTSNLFTEIMSLDIKYKIPIHLYYYEGYSIKEIARIMNLPTATVGTRLARARKILKTRLGGNDNE